jgi:hypothetical protein
MIDKVRMLGVILTCMSVLILDAAGEKIMFLENDTLSFSQYECMRTVANGCYTVGFKGAEFSDTAVKVAHVCSLFEFDYTDQIIAPAPWQKYGDDPAKLVSAILDFYAGNNLTVHRFWIDVVGPGYYWSEHPAENMKYLAAVVHGLKRAGQKLLVLSIRAQWNSIMGSEWSDVLDDVGAVYASDDYSLDFNDWNMYSYGRWNVPALKIFQSQVLCGEPATLAWHP